MGWLNRERLGVYPKIICVFYLLILSYLYLGGSGWFEVRGDPSGGDISHYWVASSLALTAGRPRFTILTVSWRPRKRSFIKARGKANASQGLR